MHLRSHVRLLSSTKKQLLTRPLVASQSNRSHYATSAQYPESIGILGGGISGLASAYFIAKEFPSSKITVYDKADRLGGWIHSTPVELDGGRRVVFESGPRALRPASNSIATTHLFEDLGIFGDDELLTNPKRSPAAQNRYIYYPDKLQRMPRMGHVFGDLFRLQMSGILGGFLLKIIKNEFDAEPTQLRDESVGSFITRRFGKEIAENMVSALLHGIYAGDIHQLSIRSIFPTLWQYERQFGGVIRAQGELLRTITSDFMTIVHPYEAELDEDIMREISISPEVAVRAHSSSLFTLNQGLERLVRRLEQRLRAHPNVSIQLHSEFEPIHAIEGKEQQMSTDQNGKLQFSMLQGGERKNVSHDLVIKTLPENQFLDDFTPVTVMTVNLFFKEKDILPVTGFGYLIPQSVAFEQNPERALGVIFDSDVFPGREDGGPSQDTVQGTKLTVMLGGHYWNEWRAYPSQEEGIAMARTVLQRHLGITAQPAATKAALNHRCIPQYNVGYTDALLRTHEFARQKYKGKLRYTGFHYNGIGVNDCVRGAWDIVRGMKGGGWRRQVTGLERYTDERRWVEKPMFDSVWRKMVKKSGKKVDFGQEE